MPDPTDFDTIAANPPGGGEGGYDPRYGEELQTALKGMREFQAKLTVQNKQNEQMLPPGSMAVKTAKGTMDIKDLPIQTYEAMMRDRQELNQIRGAFAQEADRLQRQEQQARQQPWAQLATALSANLAQARDLPGWVQAAGRTAAQLNPTADQLRSQRMGVLGEQAQLAEKAGALDIAAARTAADTKQAELARKTAEGMDKRAADYLNRTRIAVRGGSGTPLSYEAFQSGAVASGVAPERIPGLYQAHVEEAKLAAEGKDVDTARKAKLMTFKEGLDETLAGVRGKISLNNRIAGIREAFQNSVSPTKMGFEVKLHEQKKAIDEAAAGSKEFRVLGPQVGKELKAANATNGYIDTVEHMLEQPEFAEVQGPLFQYKPADKENPMGSFTFNPQAVLPKQFKNIDRTLVESQISHEIPRLLTIMLNGQAGGASILRIEAGQKIIRDMGITGGVRPDQALGILKIVRDTNNNNVAANMRLKPNANFGEIRSLLSVDDPRNEYFFKGKKDSFGGPIQPFPDPSRRASDKQDTTPSGKDHGPAPTGVPDGRTGNGGKYIVKNGRWVDAP
jgi:hypothetical protein